MSGNEVWSRYWRGGQSHSCFAGGRPFETEFVWGPFFDGLKPAASVLDLACGAGALTRIAAGRPAGFAVTGVDYAAGLTPIEGVELHEGVALEALPFEDGAFDAVISQFGIEYADLDRAIPEAARVLAPSGALGLLVHAADGEAVQAARVRLDRVARLIAEDGIVTKARRLGEALGSGGEPAGLGAAIDRQFREETQQAQDETTRWALTFLAEVMSKRFLFPPAYVQENIATLIGELTAYQSRLSLMLDAARDEAGAGALAALLAARGLDADAPRIVHDAEGKPVAWWIAARRAPA